MPLDSLTSCSMTFFCRKEFSYVVRRIRQKRRLDQSSWCSSKTSKTSHYNFREYCPALDALKVSSRRNSSSLLLRLHTYAEMHLHGGIISSCDCNKRVVEAQIDKTNITNITAFSKVSFKVREYTCSGCNLFQQFWFGFLLSPHLLSSGLL